MKRDRSGRRRGNRRRHVLLVCCQHRSGCQRERQEYPYIALGGARRKERRGKVGVEEARLRQLSEMQRSNAKTLMKGECC